MDMEMVGNFPRDFCDIVRREDFPENLVFNVGETVIWKLKPSGIFVYRLVKSG
jgi:hypothetical protein